MCVDASFAVRGRGGGEEECQEENSNGVQLVSLPEVCTPVEERKDGLVFHDNALV